MAVPLISYPFRLSAAGAVTVVEEGSDPQLAEELAVAVMTAPGERPLVPEFGVADSAFVGFDAEALRLHVQTFGPPVDVSDVSVRFLNDAHQDVVVYFSTDED